MTNSKLTVGSVIRPGGISVYSGELLYVVYIDLVNDRMYLIDRNENLLIATYSAYSKVIDANNNINISKRLTSLRAFLFSEETFLKRLFDDSV